MSIDEIFREYDLRGVYGKELTEDFVYRLGQAFSLYLKECFPDKDLSLAVGGDVRLSTDSLKFHLIKGLLESGTDVYDLGICPSPLLYFSLFQLSVSGGIMVTGSHNPPEYNGFKICAGKNAIYGEEIRHLKELFLKERKTCSPIKQGILKKKDIITPYVQHLTKNFSKLSSEPPLKIAVDAGSATAGPVALKLFPKLGCKLLSLYCEPDGNFPHHHPDPTVPENLKDLQETVLKEECDFGVAYDGDADRLGVVDEKGEVVWGDKLLTIFARDVLSSNIIQTSPSKVTVIAEVKCSQVLYDEIEKAGGRAIMYKTGHSLIKKKMKEEEALLAGEMSGHFFFADRYFGFDDAIYATCRLIEIFKKKRKDDPSFVFSDLLADIPQTHSTSELRVACEEAKKKPVLEKIHMDLTQHQKEGKFPLIKGIITVDGLRVIFDRGWGLVRASNTQPVLVLRFEANDSSGLGKIRDFIEDKLNRCLKG